MSTLPRRGSRPRARTRSRRRGRHRRRNGRGSGVQLPPRQSRLRLLYALSCTICSSSVAVHAIVWNALHTYLCTPCES
eukprot:6250840-Heterocapsa_arctica.AAC.1